MPMPDAVSWAWTHYGWLPVPPPRIPAPLGHAVVRAGNGVGPGGRDRQRSNARFGRVGHAVPRRHDGLARTNLLRGSARGSGAARRLHREPPPRARRRWRCRAAVRLGRHIPRRHGVEPLRGRHRHRCLQRARLHRRGDWQSRLRVRRGGRQEVRAARRPARGAQGTRCPGALPVPCGEPAGGRPGSGVAQRQALDHRWRPRA